jgi:hypothetical protein
MGFAPLNPSYRYSLDILDSHTLPLAQALSRRFDAGQEARAATVTVYLSSHSSKQASK